MKTLKLFLMATGVLFTSLTFQSCLDADAELSGILATEIMLEINREQRGGLVLIR